MTKSIGLIGIGVMGSNIALNFSEKGTSVHVFNQSEDKICLLYTSPSPRDS